MKAIASVAMVWGSLSLAAPVKVPVKVVEELHPAEPYPALAFHDGGLWVGTARGDEGILYLLRRYDASGELQSEVQLPHTVTSIFPVGPNRVIVVGKSYRDEWRTHYSDVSLRGGALRAKSYRFSRSYQVEEFAGDAKRWFFTDPGSRSLLKLGTLGPANLGVQISGPGMMALLGDALFVLERNGFALGDENLVRVDLKKNTAERVFGSLRKGLVSMLPINGGGRLAVSELGANQVLLVDGGTARQGHAVAIPAGSPRALATRGHCLVVGTDDPIRKVVSYVDLRLPEPKVVAEWDLSGAPSRFNRVFSLAVDPASKRVFARSHEACLRCTESSNFVVMASPPKDDPAAICD